MYCQLLFVNIMMMNTKRLQGLLTLLISLLVIFIAVGKVSAAPFQATLIPPKVEFKNQLKRGEEKKFDVQVRNDSTTDNLRLYVQKSDLEAEDESGTPVFVQEPLDTTYSLASWMSFDKDSLFLEPGETGKVNVTLNVPQDAEAGGHYGAIWFSTAPANIEGETGVGVSARLISQVITEVEGDINRDITIQEFKTPNKFNQGLPITFDAKIKNDGNTHFKPQGRIRVRNLITKKEYNIQFNPGGLNILPGVSRRISTDWEENENEKDLIPKIGIYEAELRLAGDIPYVQNNNVAITFWILPPKLIIGVIAIIVIIFVIFKLYGNMVVKRAGSKKVKKKKK